MKKFNKNREHLNQKLMIALQLFIDHLSTKNKSKNTIKNYEIDVMEFLLWLQNIHGTKIDNVSKRVVTEYIQHLSPLKNSEDILNKKLNENPWSRFFKIFAKKSKKTKTEVVANRSLSPSSRKRKISALSQFYNYLIADDYFGKKVLVNPVNKILHTINLKDSEINHTVRLSHEDFNYLVEKNWNPKEQLILHLLFWGGLRLAEITRLKNTDLEVDTQSIKLIRKGGSIHKLKIQNFSKIEFLWNKYISRQKLLDLDLDNHHEFYLFSSKISQTPKPITNRAMANIIYKCLKKCNLHTKGLSPHSFRKGCATELYYQTKDLLKVRDYLNHQDAKVTQTYIDLIETNTP